MKIKSHLIRLSILFLGFLAMSLGVVIIVKADIGNMPWDVLHQGLAYLTGLSFGQVSIIVGYSILALGCLFKIYPGPGTVANIMSLGIMIDFIKPHIPPAQNFMVGLIMNIIGSIIIGLGVALYLKAKYGAGARDSLLMGLVMKTKKSFSVIRPIVEGTVLVIGIILGGNFGVGTFISLFIIGIFVDIFFKWLKFDPKREKQITFLDLLPKKKQYSN